MEPRKQAILNFLLERGVVQFGQDRQNACVGAHIIGKTRMVLQGESVRCFPEIGIIMWVPSCIFLNPLDAINWFLGRHA